MRPAQITFLGSGDAFGSGGRFQPCILLDDGSQPLLLDCGATTLIALKRSGINPASIGWVALSHLHGDHFSGVPWLVLDGQFAKRARPLLIAGPSGTQERLERTFEALYPGSAGVERSFETGFVEFVEREPRRLGPAVITPFEVCHGGGATPYALRVEYAGRVIAYSGDTEWTDALVAVAAGADIFICECNFYDTRAPGHLDYQTLVEKRSALDCERIVLTHMSDEMLSRLDEIDLDVAQDGASIAV
jgi:ribonuclease BN (tRNA processing enzyme)